MSCNLLSPTYAYIESFKTSVKEFLRKILVDTPIDSVCPNVTSNVTTIRTFAPRDHPLIVNLSATFEGDQYTNDTAQICAEHMSFFKDEIERRYHGISVVNSKTIKCKGKDTFVFKFPSKSLMLKVASAKSLGSILVNIQLMDQMSVMRLEDIIRSSMFIANIWYILTREHISLTSNDDVDFVNFLRSQIMDQLFYYGLEFR